MTDESKSNEVKSAGPRLQIVDLLAIVAAFAIAFGFVCVLFEPKQTYFGPSAAFGRPPAARSSRSVHEIALESFFAVAIGTAFVHPAMIVTEYFTRRRRRLVDLRTSVGMFPAFAIATLFASVPLRIGVLAWYILAPVSIVSPLVSFLLLAPDNPKSAWRWTDYYGCVLAILYALPILVFTPVVSWLLTKN